MLAVHSTAIIHSHYLHARVTALTRFTRNMHIFPVCSIFFNLRNCINLAESLQKNNFILYFVLIIFYFFGLKRFVCGRFCFLM